MNHDFLNKQIHERLIQEICPIHHKHPIITWEGNTMQARCCCDEFREHIGNRAEIVAQEVADKFATEQLRKIFSDF